MRLTSLIQYLVWFATSQDINLTTNRLVKFLYLVDVFHARRFKGKTLTELPWAFVNYGPYCREAMEAIDQTVATGLISKITRESQFGDDKEFHIFSCKNDDSEKIANELNVIVVTTIETAIKHFGTDTPALLDFVYFDTEPMQKAANKFDRLDFSTCKPVHRPDRIRHKKISTKHIKAGRALLAEIVKEHRQGIEDLKADELAVAKWKDDKYHEAMNAMEDDDLSPGLGGVARIVH